MWAILLAWIILFVIEGIAFLSQPMIGLLLRTAVSGPWLVAHAFLGTTITTNLAFQIVSLISVFVLYGFYAFLLAYPRRHRYLILAFVSPHVGAYLFAVQLSGVSFA